MEKSDKLIFYIFFCILLFFMLLSVSSVFARQILPRIGIFSKKEAAMGELTQTGLTIFDSWVEEYPFSEMPKATDVTPSFIERYESVVNSVETRVENYTSKMLLGYEDFVFVANEYVNAVGWNFASYQEYNGVVKLPDGYLSGFTPKYNPEECAKSVIEFSDYCKSMGTELLFVQAPGKISEFQDRDISGTLDYSNQNSDEFLKIIGEGGVDYLDLREKVQEEGFTNHTLFYKTDHHWQPKTGLWAAGETLAYCNEKYGFNADINLLDEEAFDYTVYSNWFLGSEGKKVTSARTEPDDFYLMYPKYETRLHYQVVDTGYDEIGDISGMYDMSRVEQKDLYNQSPYHAYNWGDRGLIKMENLMECDNHKVLIIHDSFGDVFTSWIGLCEKNVHTMNLAVFDGSVRKYVAEERPDLVLILYYPPGVGVDVKWDTHKEPFDFR